MLDIFLRTVAVANSRGEFVSDDDLARLSKFSRESDKRLFIVGAIAGNTKAIIASSVRALFQEEPYLIDPGGSAYTNRQLAACLRDLEIIIRYVTYAFIAGDDDVLRERCLNGLRETYQALGVPGSSVANAIQKIRDNAISIISNSPEFDEDYIELLSELTEYFNLAASEVMMLYFYPQIVEKGWQEEIHEYLIALSLGLDIKTTKLHRFIPVQIYLPVTEQQHITKFFKVVDDTISSLGFKALIS
jgi:phycocyanin beta chain